jgi:hypothetical protein
MWPSLHQLQEVILILCAVHGTTGKTSQKRIHDHSNSWGKNRSINTGYKLKDPACFHNWNFNDLSSRDLEGFKTLHSSTNPTKELWYSEGESERSIKTLSNFFCSKTEVHLVKPHTKEVCCQLLHCCVKPL